MQQNSSPSPYSSRPLLKRRPVQLVLLALLVGGVWFALHGSSDTGPKGPPPVQIKVATVTRNAAPLTLEAVGTVVAYETVAVRARLDSQVVRVHFKDGDEVKKGDLLFELDDSTLRAQAAQLTANIARDRAQLENARRQKERAGLLAAKGFATKATRDDTEANAQAAEATVASSMAQLDNVRAQLAYTRIIAPISGRTGTINVTLGNTVKANDATPLVTINQVKPIRVQASLPQNMFDAVREAMQAGPVAVSAQKQNASDSADAEPLAQGTLEYIDNGVDQSTGTFATRAGFENPEERLWPGMFVTMKMTLGMDKNALIIPEVAVQHGQAGDFVYVIKENKAARRDIKVGRLQDGIAVIASGLAEGEVVATDGLLGLKDGSAVAIKVAADREQASTPAKASALEKNAAANDAASSPPATLPPPTPAEKKP